VSDRDAFLRAIADRQGDPLARMQFADWLDDRDPVAAAFQRILAEPDRHDLRLAWADMVGGERGEFVAVQVELATLTDADGRPKPGWSELIERYHRKLCREDATLAAVKHRDALRRRERELLTNMATSATSPLNWVVWEPQCLRGECVCANLAGDAADTNPHHCPRITFARGFVSSVTLSWADWQAHADALLAACPIRRVNRPRACGECQGQGCERIVPQRGGWPAACPTCRGTGRVAAWVGGGRVVLTTWPATHWIRGGAPGLSRLQLLGPDGPFGETVPYGPTSDMVTRLLDAEWPGVDFGLPAARGQAGNIWFAELTPDSWQLTVHQPDGTETTTTGGRAVTGTP
jgi:uncharacterized protein (TIGR02996 family)